MSAKVSKNLEHEVRDFVAGSSPAVLRCRVIPECGLNLESDGGIG